VPVMDRPDTLPAASAPTDRGLDARYYADLLWRSRVLVTAAVVGGMGLGLLAAEVQTPQYRSRALIQVAPPSPTSIGVADALVGTGSFVRDRQFFNTQFSVLSSRELARRVVDRLKLTEQPAFRGSSDPAGVFLDHLEVEPVPETLMMELRVTHPDPGDAALWANTLAEVYIDDSIGGQVEAARRAYDWVSERLAETQKAMQEAQDKLLKSYQGQEIFVAEGSVSAVASSIGKLNDDHVQAQARRIALEAELREVAEMRRRGQSLETLPQVAADPIFQDLAGKLEALKIDLSRLTEKYKQAHPEIQKVERQVEQIRKAREARALQIEQGLRTEHRQVQRREAELREAIEAQKGQVVAQSRKLTELESLKKQADSANNLYTVLLQKLNETNIAASIQNNNVRLLDRAVIPTSPFLPRKRRMSLLGALAGLVLGAGFVLLRDYLASTIRSAEDVERYLHLEMLAAVPRYGKDNQQMATEAYQTLRTALLFARKGTLGQVVLVSGTAPGEGKTTTLLNLAKLLAVSGEGVVVLDGDLRRAALHRRLDLQREPGLTDLFTRGADLDAVLQPTRVKNLFAVTAGPLPPNPPALLGRAEVETWLAQLRRHFRWVLIDSPPLASVTDALLLARHADLTLLVVQHDQVDKKVIKRSLHALRKATPSVLGAVLNAVDVKAPGQYYYYPQDKAAPGEAKRRRGALPAGVRDAPVA
ncbi:MAG TPA: polysaccharide biosynthesis tyrosine autokinase, partial [Vicinamibacteria bacterium]|nr:polysaccharide biosynthesis tyrosine autokinase [Vicinamibacteria bacterium]